MYEGYDPDHLGDTLVVNIPPQPLAHELRVLRAALHRAYTEIKSSDGTPSATALLAVARLTNAIARLTLVQQQVQPIERTNRNRAYNDALDEAYRERNRQQVEQAKLKQAQNPPQEPTHYEPDPSCAGTDFAKSWPYH